MNVPALEFLVLTVVGWLGRRQATMVEYLVAETGSCVNNNSQLQREPTAKCGG